MGHYTNVCTFLYLLKYFYAETGTKVDRQTPVDSSIDDCAICMCPPTRPEKLPCGHSFCKKCIQQAFAKCQPKCPTCGYVCGEMNGNQPRGHMTTQILPSSLTGYERYSTIQITYDIPDGVQDVREHDFNCCN